MHLKIGIFSLPEETQHEQWSEEILEDMDDLESKEYVEQRTNQRVQGLKILIPSQMRSRLPISLVQIKTEITNSEKFKNEIKQLLYSLYRSKKMNKTIYNDLINTIWKWKQSLWTLKIVAQVSVTIFFVNLLTRKHDKNLPT